MHLFLNSSRSVLGFKSLKKITYSFTMGALLWSTAAQAQYQSLLDSPNLKNSLEQVDPEAIKSNMAFLSDDLFEGRKIGERGFDLAAKYMASRFQEIGLTPGVNKTSYFQEILFRKGEVMEQNSSLEITNKGQNIPLTYGTDYFLMPNFGKTQSQANAQVVFVGYGVTAPELKYDDYDGVNVKGKIVMYLTGAPASFPNDERAYYASEMAKHQAAVAKGAVGVLTIVAANANNTLWDAYLHRYRSGSYKWMGPDGTPGNYFPALQTYGYIFQPSAEKLFEGSKITMAQALSNLKAGKTASKTLTAKAQINVSSKHSSIASQNIVGIVPGSDPELKNEYVVYASHLDHLGITTPVNGDSINNGAHDNASGSAILLEMAKTYKRLDQAPKRSIIFLSCTGEELGLLGSDYFASNPVVPGNSIVANLALDMPFFLYPLKDIIPHGIQHSSLKKQVEATTQFFGLQITPDPAPEEVVFTRSDHYSFIKKGVPALFIKGGIITDDPKKDGAKIIADWRKNIYHKIDDEMDQPFDFTGAAMHAKVNFLIGYLVAQDQERPTWNKGDFFGNKFNKQK
ncbi:M28 family metallopeptidase [Adhaeribacter aquaticus]|uniref:M28 family metallopeptidase n=1 Tax=Adhaeribacter aquaticus TaxID=299567 RepID=UPI000418944C|nr:M28 family metallopeptidase [Adhaeribacter aquaticus]